MPQPPARDLAIPAIAVGGAVGAALRHLVAVWLPNGPADWPSATLLVNLLGALAMGVLLGALTARTPIKGTVGALARPFLGVGVLGGFTTMSAQAFGTVELAQSGRPLLALGYAASTAIGAVSLAALGWWLTVRFRSRRDDPTTSTTGQDPRTRALVGLVVAIASALVVVVAIAFAGAGAAVGWIALGAAVGAPLRYLTDRLVQLWHSSSWPWGTLTVNLLGSLLLGALAPTSGAVALALGTGFCGAYTTWSTTAHESASLLRQRHLGYGLAYPVVSVLVCVGAAWCGALLGGWAGP